MKLIQILALVMLICNSCSVKNELLNPDPSDLLVVEVSEKYAYCENIYGQKIRIKKGKLDDIKPGYILILKDEFKH